MGERAVRARVLLIEEDHALRRLVEDHIERLGGFSIETAEEGELGLERATFGSYDIVVASFHLSEIPPRRLVETLASVRRPPAIVVLARPDRVKALGSAPRGGVIELVPLPLHRAMLTDALLRSVRRRQERLCGGIISPKRRRPEATSTTPAARTRSGKPISVGHFEIVAPLGGGPKGAVYRAIDRRDSQPVVLRAIPQSMLERLGRGNRWFERFVREATVVAEAEHLRLARLLDHGFDEEHRCLYLVHRDAPGRPLAERLAEGALDAAATLRIALQVSSALMALHEVGGLHRQVNLRNVLIDDQGDVILTDAGVASILGWDFMPLEERLSAQPFDAPEQLELSKADERSDQYSLGLVLWSCLLGGYPVPGKSAIARARAISARSLAFSLPREMPRRDESARLLARMTSRSPAHRFPDDKELHTALLELADAVA